MRLSFVALILGVASLNVAREALAAPPLTRPLAASIITASPTFNRSPVQVHVTVPRGALLDRCLVEKKAWPGGGWQFALSQYASTIISEGEVNFGDSAWVRPAQPLRRRLLKVTGILGERAEAEVEFEWDIEGLPAWATSSTPQQGKATFRLYDDGWRATNVTTDQLRLSPIDIDATLSALPNGCSQTRNSNGSRVSPRGTRVLDTFAIAYNDGRLANIEVWENALVYRLTEGKSSKPTEYTIPWGTLMEMPRCDKGPAFIATTTDKFVINEDPKNSQTLPKICASISKAIAAKNAR